MSASQLLRLADRPATGQPPKERGDFNATPAPVLSTPVLATRMVWPARVAATVRARVASPGRVATKSGHSRYRARRTASGWPVASARRAPASRVRGVVQPLHRCGPVLTLDGRGHPGRVRGEPPGQVSRPLTPHRQQGVGLPQPRADEHPPERFQVERAQQRFTVALHLRLRQPDGACPYPAQLGRLTSQRCRVLLRVPTGPTGVARCSVSTTPARRRGSARRRDRRSGPPRWAAVRGTPPGWPAS